MAKVNIAKDFTKYPAGRFKKNGETSGEEFRERFLEPFISKGETVTVEFDGTLGYGSSFLEEAFGGLVRKLGLGSENVLSKLELVSDDPSLIAEIKEYVLEAGQSRKK